MISEKDFDENERDQEGEVQCYKQHDDYDDVEG
jgi:hypothetical protein